MALFPDKFEWKLSASIFPSLLAACIAPWRCVDSHSPGRHGLIAQATMSWKPWGTIKIKRSHNFALKTRSQKIAVWPLKIAVWPLKIAVSKWTNRNPSLELQPAADYGALSFKGQNLEDYPSIRLVQPANGIWLGTWWVPLDWPPPTHSME